MGVVKKRILHTNILTLPWRGNIYFFQRQLKTLLIIIAILLSLCQVFDLCAPEEAPKKLSPSTKTRIHRSGKYPPRPSFDESWWGMNLIIIIVVVVGVAQSFPEAKWVDCTGMFGAVAPKNSSGNFLLSHQNPKLTLFFASANRKIEIKSRWLMAWRERERGAGNCWMLCFHWFFDVFDFKPNVFSLLWM